MKKTLLFASAFAILAASPAFAGAEIAIPAASWFQGIADFISTISVPVISLAVAFAARHVPASYVNAQRTKAVEQLLERAVQYGLNIARAKIPNGVSLPVTSDVIAQAANYAITHGPKIVQWAGGAKAIEDKILARLDVKPATPAAP